MVLGYNRDLRHDDVWNNQLCVPDDNLDDLEFFPNFFDDLIRLAGFPLDVDDEGEDSRKDFDAPISRPPTFPYERETNLSVFRDGKSRAPTFPSFFKDEESRDVVFFPYEQESGKKPSGRKTCLSVKRRICSHCQSEKTPQWREGPNGPKTLCNACGVRYKSGRLVPEYRPAASPSFDSRKHSNYHKRILRNVRSYRKEMQ